MEQFSAAIRLRPLDPHSFLFQAGMAYAHFFAGRYQEGISWATSAIQGQSSFPGAQRTLMANLLPLPPLSPSSVRRNDALFWLGVAHEAA
jgi:hypothetical protein